MAGDRRWVSVNPPDFLDLEGAELVLIGGRDDVGADVESDLQAHPIDEEAADVFHELHMEKSERTKKALVRGTWD